MGYILCLIGGFVIGASKGDDIQNTIQKSTDRRWSDYQEPKMEGLLMGFVCFGLGVYFAEPVREVAPILDPQRGRQV